MPLYEVITDKQAFGRQHYARGEVIDVSPDNVKHAELLCNLRKLKATDSPAKNKTDLPKPVAKVEEAPVEPEAPLSRSYHRRDMVAEGSQTGEDSLSPSSRRGRPRKAWYSNVSEDDSES